MPIAEVDATGVSAQSLAENRDEIFAELRSIFGDDLSSSPQTPQAQIAGIQALRDTEIGEMLVRSALMGSSVDHAEGVFLEALGSALGIRRFGALRTRVSATLRGTGGTVLQKGILAKTANEDMFRSTAEVELVTSETASVVFEAVEEGNVECAAGALTMIVSVIAGWDSITNAAAGAIGRPKQSDEQYRESYVVRAARRATGPIAAIRAGIMEMGADDQRVVENRTEADAIVQAFTIARSSILAVIEGGEDSDLDEVIERYRGVGSGTMTAIRGGTIPSGGFTALSSDESMIFAGATYEDLDFSSDTTNAARATTLAAGMSGSGVRIAIIDGRFVAIFPWMPELDQVFDSSAAATAFGFNPAAAIASPGPFIRARDRELTITFDLSRQPGFPADGLDLARQAVISRIERYGIGEQLWTNDILAAAEGIGGTRVTNLVVQYGGVDVSGVDPPLDGLWAVGASSITITVT